MAIQKSSGNVFADLELPNPEVKQLRSALACEIFKIIERRELKQRDAAKILGIDQPEVSKLKNGRFDQFSIERLMTFLNRLDQDVKSLLINIPEGQNARQECTYTPNKYFFSAVFAILT